MPKFAVDTDVPVERTRAEIENVTNRYGASEFMSGWIKGRAMIGFAIGGRRVRFVLPLPDKAAREFTHGPASGRIPGDGERKQVPRSPESAAAAWEKACRQRWRALLLAIRAKLEAVDCQIATFEEEFMAHIVMPDGRTIGEQILPALPAAFEAGEGLPMLSFEPRN